MRENIVGPAIVELVSPDVAVVDKPTKIEDLRCIGSYTWDKKRKPALIVPGSPRVWVDREMPFQVPFDSGIRMFHEDAFYMANESTLIPLFRAVDTMALGTESGLSTGENVEAINWAAVDFVTDRNNLRKLLRWVREPGPTKIQTSSPVSETAPLSPTSDGSDGSGEKQGRDFTTGWDPRKDFRIDLQLGGANTVLMERWAARAREVISPPKGGCRSNFEQEHTMAAEVCENGGGHYRIVRYSIGGLNMVVRFEVDACIPETTSTAAGKRPEPNEWTEDIAEPGDTRRDIATRESTKSPARQSFTDNEEGESRAENRSTPEISTPSEVKPKKQEDEEVDLDKEAALWAGGDDDSWGALPAPPRSVKGERSGRELKEDARSQAPPPQDLSWDLPEDDGSAWGLTPDTTQDEEVEANGELTVVRSGTLLPQSSILELATRSIRYADRTSNEDVFFCS
uniref:Tetrahydroxynaphthalene reductase (THNR)) n=1 Tax=Ganoderma boninense TaxID=34458 RepID=A0A5K1K212_9APHY|nr:Tetrahydroxynaphthalene reductase (EC (T4HN reductase) (THNR) [Ganoderma boninense]